LDSHAWRDADWLSPGLSKVFGLYTSGIMEDRICLCDLDIKQYPPTFIVAGARDPLGLTESAKKAHEMLETIGCHSKLGIYDGTHGFCGYPVQMQQALTGGCDKHWKQTAHSAMLDTIDFCNKHHN